MHFTTILSLLLGASSAFATPTLEKRTNCAKQGLSNAGAVSNAFSASGVVPTLIPSINPKVAVNVNYNGRKVNLGNKFTTAETTNQPALSFTQEPGTDASKAKYAVFMIDPDVPNPDSPVRKTYLHWAFHDAQAKCIKGQKRVVDTIYESPTPASPQQHRYTFLVYRQPAGYMPDTAALQVRPGFDINSYASAHGLKLVGGNFLREAITNT